MNRYYETGVEDFRIRFAQESDVGLILKFIKELADYEELLHEVVATEEILMESLFVKKQAEVIIGEYKGEPGDLRCFSTTSLPSWEKPISILRIFMWIRHSGEKDSERHCFHVLEG